MFKMLLTFNDIHVLTGISELTFVGFMEPKFRSHTPGQKGRHTRRYFVSVDDLIRINDVSISSKRGSGVLFQQENIDVRKFIWYDEESDASYQYSTSGKYTFRDGSMWVISSDEKYYYLRKNAKVKIKFVKVTDKQVSKYLKVDANDMFEKFNGWQLNSELSYHTIEKEQDIIEKKNAKKDRYNLSYLSYFEINNDEFVKMQLLKMWDKFTHSKAQEVTCVIDGVTLVLKK